MPFSIRLRVDPIELPPEVEGGVARITGMRPAFSVYGPPPSKAERGAAKPAKLEFTGRFLDEIRSKAIGDEQPLGELQGRVTLAREGNEVTFECDSASLEELAKAPDEDEEPDEEDPPPKFEPASLEIALGEPHFSNCELADGKKPRLRLPRDAGRWTHLEVLTKLSVEGAGEADVNQNDTLDVPLRLVPRKAYPFSL